MDPVKDSPAKGARVRLVKFLHKNEERPWPMRLEAREGHAASVVHGPFKGAWYLVALDCPKEEVGKYSRYLSVTLDEIERA